MIKMLQKLAAGEPESADVLQQHPELAALPFGMMAGTRAPRKKNEILQQLLGASITGAGAVGGAALGKHYANDQFSGVVGGGTLGTLVSYLAARRALRSMYDDTEKRALSPVLSQLIEAKNLSDKKDYRGKHSKLRQLMQQYPDDFYIDSVNGDIAGITHSGTGFKIHMPIRLLPATLKGFSDVAAPAVA